MTGRRLMIFGGDRCAAAGFYMAMRILRHSKIAVTMEIYTEAPSEATCEELRSLSEQLVA